jgi:hypothetical protein
LAILILYILILYFNWFLLSIVTHARVMDKALLSDFTPLWDPGARISAKSSRHQKQGGGVLSTHLYGVMNYTQRPQ